MEEVETQLIEKIQKTIPDRKETKLMAKRCFCLHTLRNKNCANKARQDTSGEIAASFALANFSQ